MQEITDILAGLGYNWTPDAKGYRMAANFRGGDNKTSLLVYKDGGVYDFSRSEYFSLQELIQRTLNLDTPSLADEWLKQNNYSKPVNFNLQIPKLELNKVYDKECLKKLLPIHDYWINRGISEKVIKRFSGGVSKLGGTKDRYVVPIFNNKNEIIGFSGRDLTGKKLAKYKHFGVKSEWVWPAHLNHNLIKNNSVILVEGMGDVLALYECGIENTISLFGVNISWRIINFLINRAPKSIIVATNNDQFDGKTVGNEAAIKIKSKLNKYFDSGSVKIILPDKAKDINEQLLKFGSQSIRDLYQ